MEITGKDDKWKLAARYKHDFSTHFLVLCYESDFFLLGPNHISSCLLYKDKQLIPKTKMPSPKSFFSAAVVGHMIYTFGGYDNFDKIQLSSVEQYNVLTDTW